MAVGESKLAFLRQSGWLAIATAIATAMATAIAIPISVPLAGAGTAATR